MTFSLINSIIFCSHFLLEQSRRTVSRRGLLEAGPAAPKPSSPLLCFHGIVKPQDYLSFLHTLASDVRQRESITGKISHNFSQCNAPGRIVESLLCTFLSFVCATVYMTLFFNNLFGCMDIKKVLIVKSRFQHRRAMVMSFRFFYFLFF